jgi:3-isopropylmalate/(R)-2-methylmalate dehydratase small subunit
VRAIETITGRVSVLNRDDVDTDQIIPKQFLKRVERTGFGEFLFYDWAKEPGWELPSNPILVAGRNFGCGSSREHAPWALADYGFRAVISTELADIFRSNCLKNGLLPVTVEEPTSAWLISHPGAEVTLDLSAGTLTLPTGRAVTFPLEAFARHCLLQGLDELTFLLQRRNEIEAYERRA